MCWASARTEAGINPLLAAKPKGVKRMPKRQAAPLIVVDEEAVAAAEPAGHGEPAVEVPQGEDPPVLQTLAMCGFLQSLAICGFLQRELQLVQSLRGRRRELQLLQSLRGRRRARTWRRCKRGARSSWTGVWWHGDKKDRSLYI